MNESNSDAESRQFLNPVLCVMAPIKIGRGEIDEEREERNFLIEIIDVLC